jgi:hypothetical protein
LVSPHLALVDLAIRRDVGVRRRAQTFIQPQSITINAVPSLLALSTTLPFTFSAKTLVVRTPIILLLCVSTWCLQSPSDVPIQSVSTKDLVLVVSSNILVLPASSADALSISQPFSEPPKAQLANNEGNPKSVIVFIDGIRAAAPPGFYTEVESQPPQLSR